MNTLRWYAGFRGWFYFQNELRSNRDREATTYPVAGATDQPIEERKYMPYSGVVDRTISNGMVLNMKGGELTSLVGAVATLLRFEMADNADDTRNIAATDTAGRPTQVANAMLRLWCSSSGPSPQETKFYVYRVLKPWGWGRGPSPPKA